MWWRGPQGPVHFEAIRREDSRGHRLGGISIREQHPEDWQEIRFVLWLPKADVEYVAQHEVGGRQAETPEAQSEGPASRLWKTVM